MLITICKYLQLSSLGRFNFNSHFVFASHTLVGGSCSTDLTFYQITREMESYVLKECLMLTRARPIGLSMFCLLLYYEYHHLFWHYPFLTCIYSCSLSGSSHLPPAKWTCPLRPILTLQEISRCQSQYWCKVLVAAYLLFESDDTTDIRN